MQNTPRSTEPQFDLSGYCEKTGLTVPYLTELDLDLICYVDAKWICGFFLLVLRSKHRDSTIDVAQL